MGIRDEVRDKVSNWWGSPTPARSGRNGAAALTQLTDLLGNNAIEETLARFDGQSLRQLEETFSLLPLGTRMALQQVRAIRLVDQGRSMLEVVAEPLALDLVRAAARARDTDELAATERLRAELQRLRREWYILQEVTPEARPTLQAALADLGELDIVGSIRIKGSAIGTDDSDGSVVFNVLDADGKELSPGMVVHCAQAKIGSSWHIGRQVSLDFAVAVPPSMRATHASAALRDYPNSEIVRKSVRTEPGLVFAAYHSNDTEQATLLEAGSEDEASGVGYLWVVDGKPLLADA